VEFSFFISYLGYSGTTQYDSDGEVSSMVFDKEKAQASKETGRFFWQDISYTGVSYSMLIKRIWHSERMRIPEKLEKIEKQYEKRYEDSPPVPLTTIAASSIPPFTRYSCV